MTDQLLVEQKSDALYVTFNRAAQRNAMSWEMYQGLQAACERADAEDSVRVMVLRGAGGTAFVAGTDIAQFKGFTGQDGIEYEQRISAILGRLAAVRVPVIAAIEGFCIGGGLGIAAVADLRIADRGAKFGVPIARTLGNCLSASTLSVLVSLVGRARATDLLMTARLMSADEALASGFVTTVSDDVDAEVEALVRRLGSSAPLTLWATKEAMRRIYAGSTVDDEDIVSLVYGSEDFANAVTAFTSKRKPVWQGR
ncbi:enoyl-CoA hydratase/isomerase family protein [Saxibacter everestensis]|uniref:Enoyl-CoA hydratase/isomerase family protein n=1 Tax=Saxibacter everestensis TaxID=2909229 RepID=A0ABY8QVZ9_9MICO|nr:enoyl-CoA hydratase/isomerase family protein [Brevibacteriaceae bacterium ZFBP1038]